MTLAGCRTTLSGQLRLQDGSELTASPSARVNLFALNGERREKPLVLNVAHDGSFKVEDPLPAGLYFMEALVPGYKIESLRFHLEKGKEIEIRLRPLPQREHALLKAHEGPSHEARAAGGVTLNPPEM